MDILLSIVGFAVGLFILWILCKLLAFPLRLLWKLFINALAGALILIVVNLVGWLIGITIPINIINSLITGLLGVPGVILLIILQVIL